jgi:hypothetical protein
MKQQQMTISPNSPVVTKSLALNYGCSEIFFEGLEFFYDDERYVVIGRSGTGEF